MRQHSGVVEGTPEWVCFLQTSRHGNKTQGPQTATQLSKVSLVLIYITREPSRGREHRSIGNTNPPGVSAWPKPACTCGF